MNDYTLPPLPTREMHRDGVLKWGQQCAEAARAPLLARIKEQDDLLRFVERWANHHGANPCVSAKEALSVIQHHPSISDITRSYADGKVPKTFNPYARIAELEAAYRGLDAYKRALSSRVGELEAQLAQAQGNSRSVKQIAPRAKAYPRPDETGNDTGPCCAHAFADGWNGYRNALFAAMKENGDA